MAPTKPTRRNGRLLAGIAAATVAVTAGMAVAAAYLSPVPLLDHRPVPHSGTVAFHWTPPTPAPPVPAPHVTPAPADTVLAATVADAVFAGLHPQDPATDAIYGGPYAGPCPGLLNRLTPVTGVMRRGRAGGIGVAVTAWAYPAGQGAATVATLRTRVANCAADADPRPYLASTTAPGDGFVADSPNGGDGVTWAVWSRGDVVLAVTAAAKTSPPPDTAAASVAARVDTAVRKALAGVCANVDETVADAHRNPYSRDGYRPYTRPASLTVTAPDPTAPPVPVRPVPRYSPDLAALAKPVPELAPPQLPPGWQPGDPVPTGDTAPRGPAPVLVNPADIPTPNGVTVTAAPQAPTPPRGAADAAPYQVTLPDPTGPGCGWAFTGGARPHTDPAQLAAGDRHQVESAFVALTRAAADQQRVWARYARQVAAYRHADAEWQTYTAYQQQVRAAQAAWDQATTTYTDAVRTLQQLAAATTPAPVPTPTTGVTPATPTTPAPAPGAGTTPSSPASPTSGSTPLPAPVAAPTTGPTP